MVLMSKIGNSNQAQMRGIRYVVLFAGIVLAFLVSPLVNFVKADNINPSLYSTDSAPYGISYQKWVERQWQWKFAVPTGQNPLHNYSPEKCAIGQQGPVWLLDELLSGTELRTCTIPAGKSILLPVLDGQCDLSDTTIHNDHDLIQCASAGNEYGVIAASIDGVPIKNLDSYRTHTEFFNLTVPADNVFGEHPAGTYKSYADGWFLFLHPLSPGSHDIHYTVTVANPIQPKYNYGANLTYHLIMKS